MCLQLVTIWSLLWWDVCRKQLNDLALPGSGDSFLPLPWRQLMMTRRMWTLVLGCSCLKVLHGYVVGV